MNKKPKILYVETGLVLKNEDSSSDILDYHVYAHIPYFWRQIEKLLRLDLYLAIRAKMIANRYDIIWAAEKAAIPLSFMRLKQPLVVTTTHMTSPIKAMLARITGIAKNWTAVGYLTPAEREFFINDLGIDKNSLFQCISAKYLDHIPSESMTTDGPIMSIGVAKRDYKTLIEALSYLPGYTTELFVSSRYGDTLRQKLQKSIPEWIYFSDFVPDEIVQLSFCKMSGVPLWIAFSNIALLGCGHVDNCSAVAHMSTAPTTAVLTVWALLSGRSDRAGPFARLHRFP